MTDDSKIPEDYRYTKNHEWFKRDDNDHEVFFVGITDHAQKALGDIVHVEIPSIASEFEIDDEMAVVESAKSASEVFAPISGKVVAINDALDSNPELINSSPYEDGWIVKIKILELDQIHDSLSADGYQHFLEEEV